ncbi:MAG: hypothetical protein JWN72_693 [Thermoleophilia bacterium]|nr:hypothetical protein [Thermoleophilia bacterium]
MIRPRIPAALLLLAAALLIAGCGGGDDGSKDSSSSTSASTMTSTTDTDTDATMTDSSSSGDSMAAADSSNPMVGGAAMYADKPIAVNASAAPNLTTLVTAVKAAGLVDTLAGPGPFTVFAPTNDAFAKVPAATLQDLLKPANKAQLTGILTYHVVPGTYRAADLEDGQQLTTVNGAMLEVTKNGDTVSVGGVPIQTADVVQSNGVVHVIGSVLMPPTAK